MKGWSELNVGDNSVSLPSVAGVQYLMGPAVAPAHPIGIYTNPRRRTGLAAVAAIAVNDGIMASSNGRAITAPVPRKNVLRPKAFFVIIIALSSFEMACY